MKQPQWNSEKSCWDDLGDYELAELDEVIPPGTDHGWLFLDSDRVYPLRRSGRAGPLVALGYSGGIITGVARPKGRPSSYRATERFARFTKTSGTEVWINATEINRFGEYPARDGRYIIVRTDEGFESIDVMETCEEIVNLLSAVGY